MTEPGESRPIPSKRLDAQIREAALQYDWNLGIGDLYNPDKEEPTPGSCLSDDPLLRIVLLCRARSPQWSNVLRKAIVHASLKHHHERRARYIVGDAPGASQTRNELYGEMISRLVDPLTMRPVDVIGMSNRRFAREVADGNIQIEYNHATARDVSP